MKSTRMFILTVAFVTSVFIAGCTPAAPVTPVVPPPPGCTSDGITCACARLDALGCAQGGDGCEAAFARIVVDRTAYVDFACVAGATRESLSSCAGAGPCL